MTTIAADAAATVAKSFSGHPLSPATMTIFGAGGDLTKRLIVPALYHLVRAGKLPDDFAIIGVDHNDLTTEEWCGNLAEMMQAFTRAGGASATAMRSTSRRGPGLSIACTTCAGTLCSPKASASSRSC